MIGTNGAGGRPRAASAAGERRLGELAATWLLPGAMVLVVLLLMWLS